MKVEFENKIINFNVQYGNREKLSIHIDSFGFLTVRAPNNTSEEVIISAIESNGTLILEEIRKREVARDMPKARGFYEGGKFLHIGEEYFLHELIDIGELDEETLKKNLKRFYINSLKKIISERIKIYQKRLKVKPKSFEVVESKTKWGSCNSDRKLTFNYRLAMAPIEVIDYVVIHELCHLSHMNHDRSFWRLVGSIMPDYKEKEAYLARHGRSMSF